MIELHVNGMTCGHCVGVVTRAVKSVDLNATIAVDLGSKRVRVDGQSSVSALRKALAEAGYPAMPAGVQAPATPARRGCCCST